MSDYGTRPLRVYGRRIPDEELSNFARKKVTAIRLARERITGRSGFTELLLAVCSAEDDQQLETAITALEAALES